MYPDGLRLQSLPVDRPSTTDGPDVGKAVSPRDIYLLSIGGKQDTPRKKLISRQFPGEPTGEGEDFLS
jgi:hypothetical protein